MEKSVGINRELPVDLLFEILAKLPIKSLCRLRCVSKLWRSVIADPHFVEAQRACSEPRLESIVLFPGREQDYHAYTCNLDTPVDEYYDGHHELTAIHELVPNENPAIPRGCMSHQIGGLYCLDFGKSVRVWNPSTRESLDISTGETEHFFTTNLFGYDPVEKKHKVLSISADLHTQKAFSSRVFILEENRWRTLADVYPLKTAYLGFLCVDGVIFSAPCDLFGRWIGKTLVAFHVGSETFQLISLPKKAKHVRLVELSGRATLVESDLPCPRDSQTISMWMLEDLHQPEPVWRHKPYSIPSYDLHRRIPLCGTPTGELLFWGGPESGFLYLLLYNVENRKLRRIVVNLPSEHRGKQGEPLIRFHVESVQSPNAASS